MIAPTFWTRGPGKKLRGNPTAVALVLYLSTSPASNMIGLFYQPLPMICHDLGLRSEDELRALLALPAVQEVVRYDFDAELVWLPEHAREQLGDVIKPADKRRPGIQRELAAFNGHPFAAEFASRYGAAFSLDSKPLQSPTEGAPKGLPRAFEAPVSVSVSSSVSGSGSADAPDNASEPSGHVQDPVERETICPLDLVDKLKALKVHTELAHALKVDVGSVVTALEEFVSYWTIGGGTGQRRHNWPRKARERVRKLAEEQRLPAPAPEQPSTRDLIKAQQREAAAEARRRQDMTPPTDEEFQQMLSRIGRGGS